MHIHVQLTEGIINQCLWQHFNFHPIGRRQQRRLLWIPMILLAVAAYLIGTELQKEHVSQNLYLGLLYILIALTYYFYMKKRMFTSGKTMVKALGNNADFDMEMTITTITTITKTSTITNDWTVFTGALISETLVLLYQQNDTFSMYHESFFKDADFAQFKTWVRNEVRPIIDREAI